MGRCAQPSLRRWVRADQCNARAWVDCLGPCHPLPLSSMTSSSHPHMEIYDRFLELPQVLGGLPICFTPQMALPKDQMFAITSHRDVLAPHGLLYPKMLCMQKMAVSTACVWDPHDLHDTASTSIYEKLDGT